MNDDWRMEFRIRVGRRGIGDYQEFVVGWGDREERSFA
jgi:hypothetical protein